MKDKLKLKNHIRCIEILKVFGPQSKEELKKKLKYKTLGAVPSLVHNIRGNKKLNINVESIFTNGRKRKYTLTEQRNAEQRNWVAKNRMKNSITNINQTHRSAKEVIKSAPEMIDEVSEHNRRILEAAIMK